MSSATVINHNGRRGDYSNFSYTSERPASVEYLYKTCSNLLFENGELSRLLIDVDYGAYHYDAVLRRWTTMDSLCEKMITKGKLSRHII